LPWDEIKKADYQVTATDKSAIEINNDYISAEKLMISK
jgi:hypothetical protein